MNDELPDLDKKLHALYRSHKVSEVQVEQVIRRIAEGAPLRRRYRWRSMIAVAAALAAAVWLTAWFVLPPAPADKPPPLRTQKKSGTPQEKDRPLVFLTLPNQHNHGNQEEKKQVFVPSAKSALGADSSGAPDMRPFANVIAIAEVAKSVMTQKGPAVILEIERVLKGNKLDGRILTKDELPRLGFCPAQPPPRQTISDLYPLQSRVVLYLHGSGENWTLYEIHELYPRYLKIYEAARSKEPKKNLKPLLTVENGGLDRDARFLLRTFAPKQEATALLLELLREIPAQLVMEKSEAKGNQVIHLQLRPLVAMLTGTVDGNGVPQALTPLLDCLPQLDRPNLEMTRADVYLGLAELARSPKAKPHEVEQVRQEFLAKTRGSLDPKHMKKVAAGYMMPRDVSVAVRELTRFVNSGVVDVLLKELARRPFTLDHDEVNLPLSGALEFKLLSKMDRNRIKKAWLQALLNFKPGQDVYLAESISIESIAGALYFATSKNYVSLTPQERKQLRALYQNQPAGWYRDALERFVRKPADEEKGAR